MNDTCVHTKTTTDNPICIIIHTDTHAHTPTYTKTHTRTYRLSFTHTGNPKYLHLMLDILNNIIQYDKDN